MQIKIVGINARFTHSCLALFYLRNELEAHIQDVGVTLCQYTINDPLYSTVQRLAAGDTDYFFFSAFIWNSEMVERLIEDLLMLNEAWHIVVGGPQAEEIGLTFQSCERVSSFVGNIEGGSTQFYDDIRSKKLKKRYQASRPVRGDAVLAYPYRSEDFREGLQDRSVYYESSRGCPFSCSYCLSSVEKGLFHKPLPQVFAELDDIISHHPKTVRFVDRTFNDLPERALSIWRFLVKKDPPILFHFELAPDRFTEEMLAFLETIRAGLFQFEIGIQSTNPKTLAAINRSFDPESAGRAITRLRRAENIHLHVDLILGLPEETPATFMNSINEVCAMKPHYIQMGLLKLLPGTAIARCGSAGAYKAGRRPPYNVFANKWMDAAELRALYLLGECLERFVNSRYFVSVWHYLLTNGHDMAAFFYRLSRSFIEQGYPWLSTTQQTLSQLLLEQFRQRDDFRLVRELLCYDWLRCGHRFLPEHVHYHRQPLEELRRQLFHHLPEEIEGLFDRHERNHVIKKSIYHRFSREALQYTGVPIEEEEAIVCFSPHRDERVHRLQKTVVIPISI